MFPLYFAAGCSWSRTVWQRFLQESEVLTSPKSLYWDNFIFLENCWRKKRFWTSKLQSLSKFQKIYSFGQSLKSKIEFDLLKSLKRNKQLTFASEILTLNKAHMYCCDTMRGQVFENIFHEKFWTSLWFVVLNEDFLQNMMGIKCFC